MYKILCLHPCKFQIELNNKSDGGEIRTRAHKFQRPRGFYCLNHSATPSIIFLILNLYSKSFLVLLFALNLTLLVTLKLDFS